jgi:hypothetical protein
MKKILLIGLLCFISVIAAAQTGKSEFLVGMGTSLGLGQNDGLMGIAFTNSKTEIAGSGSVEERQTSLFLSVRGGYFIANGLVTGLELVTSTSTGTTKSAGLELDSQSSFFGAGPWVRYYFSSQKIIPFAEFNSLFGSRGQTTEGSGIDSDLNYTVSNLGGGLGIVFLLGEKSSLDLSLTYNGTNLKEKDLELTTNQNSLGMKVGFSMFF